MDEFRKILEFKIDNNQLHTFIDDNRAIIANEIITAAEEMLYNGLDETLVCKINLNDNNSKTILNCRLTVNDIIRDMDALLDWGVENEEYELCHRIKLLIDYMEENDIRRKKETADRTN